MPENSSVKKRPTDFVVREDLSNSADTRFLDGGGEMGERIRGYDWSGTPAGPIESWSPALRMMLGILLANRFPLLLWWGPHYISFYNDAYIPILGTKHPAKALALPVSECWSEIWHVLKPLIDGPFEGGAATWMEDIQLEINRYGFVEETHFTIAYSPVPDESVPSRIGGVLATVHEITAKIISERRIVALRDLGARMIEAKSAEAACRNAAKALAAHHKDIPFALLYLIDSEQKWARLAGACGVAMGEAISPLTVDLSAANAAGWPLAEAQRTDAIQVVQHLHERFGTVPPGPWSDAPDTAVVLPLRSNKAHEPSGILVAGISVRLKFDKFQQGFLELLATQVATAVANARAHEQERRRAEALAEIDRAKTAFFSNVSHEFRTPLTLILGPIEELLARSGQSPDDHRELEVIHRNSQRLLKLVNTLLDFSRVEAGRIRASYEPTDLAAYTAELASVFRAGTQKAGLRLVVDCPPLPEVVHVDCEMWETIVLNLMSNALKFTFEGEIEVTMRWRGERVEFSVRDTGIGIPDSELPRIFGRFHRVRGARSRTPDSTGIGLALVQELAHLHAGEIRVESREGCGTTFTLSIPTGTAHLPPDQIAAARQLEPTSIRAIRVMDEALGFLPGVGAADSLVAMEEAPLRDSAAELETAQTALSSKKLPRVLIADDNDDMREYLRRLLAPHYQVEAVNDGQAALERARARRPDLLLADVMMPRLDGFGLLKQLRADDRMRSIPVIMLSARAGEEAREEGLNAGADDYLIKPFSARELLAHVRSQLDMSRLRVESEAHLREKNAELAQRVIELQNANAETQNARRAAMNVMEDAVQSRRLAEALAIDVRENEERYRTLFSSMDEGFCVIDMIFDEHGKPVDYRFLEVNPMFGKQTGLLEATGKRMRELVPDLEEHWFEIYGNVALTGEPIRFVNEAKPMEGRWFDGYACRVGGPDSCKVAIIFNDITKRKQTELALNNAIAVAEKANRAKTDFLSSMSHELRTPLGAILGFAQLMESASPPPTTAQKRSIDQILQAGWYLLEMINEILDLALIESGKLSLSLESIGLAEVMHECQSMIEPQAQKRDISVAFPSIESAYFVRADRTRLKQVLINLLSNAIKYNKVGGTIAVDCIASTAERIRICVKDTGAGLMPEEVAQLFQPFNRIGQEASAEEGTGIGLVVCKRLVELMKGEIGVESTVGKGSVFWFELNLTSEPQLAATAESTVVSRAQVHAGAQLRTVLYVEDNPANLMLIEDLVARRSDIRLLGAADGKRGIEIALASRPDVILMDINLPGISGLQALEILRDIPATAHIPVIALTANAIPRDIEKGLEAGFFRYLTKPIRVDEFMETLDAALKFSKTELARAN